MKQQKTLLNFFSPPSSTKKETTTSPGDSNTKSNGKTSSRSSKIASDVKKDKPAKDATTKRIEFSPKLKKKKAETDGDSMKKKTPVREDNDQVNAETKTGVKRKPHEDFLGTSSEEDEVIVNSNKSNERTKRTRKSPAKVIENDDSDSDEDMAAPKRPRRAKASSKPIASSEEEWDPDNSPDSDNDNESEFSAADEDASDEEATDDDDNMEEEEEERVRPAKKRRTTITPTKTSNNRMNITSPSFLSPSPSSKKSASPFSSASKKSISSSTPDAENSAGTATTGNHIHDTLPWLHEKRRDINGNKPDSPDYDPRTLYVPPEFLKKETPAMMQWWEVKSRNMDTVLFFKVGKFYELFHMDADVGFKELNLIYMKGDKAHSGFPEIAYSKMSSQLIEKGYRVARVEQTETPEMMKERNAASAKKSKVVRREMCSLLSLGTNTLSFLDAPISSQEQISRKLLALKEEVDTSLKSIRFGVCMIDCATGTFHLSEFDDTKQRDRLKTLLAQFHVVEIVTERSNLSEDTKMILKYAAPSAIRAELRVGKEFWDATRTVDEIRRSGYFNEHGWPEEVLFYLDTDKSAKMDGQLAISALGGCIWHLRRSLIDQELLSLCNFSRYKPSDEEARERNKDVLNAKAELKQQYVVLDSHTIQNLEILNNSFNGTRSGSLIDIMDKTVTTFGKRMFQDWVLKPLCKVSEINERLDAVEELGKNNELIMEVREYLRKLPDLERLLSRIHALGSAHRSKEHPDSRAIMYETDTYNIRKIHDFLSVLNGFESAMALTKEIGPRFAQFKSPILQAVLKKHSSRDEDKADIHRGHFPDLMDKLEFFKRSFDQAAAKRSGFIVPHNGVDSEFDESCAEISNIEEELEEYLKKQRIELKCKQIVYWGKKKEDRYQLEVPESALQPRQPKAYELKSRKKGYKRFHTPYIRDMLSRLSAAEDRKEEALKDQMRRIFHKFDEDYKYWMKAVQCLAVVDCLLSLALVSSQSEGYVRPEIVSAASGNNSIPFIDIEEGVHPCIVSTFDNGEFIPNDAQLGINGKGRMTLLSGPNMGGKSTLLRQTCVLAIMAQIGCFVPAAKCRMSPVDRIFTRIGASDRILAGQSTLFVELAETATILNHATNHSLVILDELGRGTSTFDGTAIAYSVVEHLIRNIQCRTMFATHYHSLVEEYADDENVALGHMGCIVDPENDRKVTFLYKLEAGMCPKSYGINVAMLAKLPEKVIETAAKKSEQFEKSLQANSHMELEALKIMRKVESALADGNMDELRKLWEETRRLISV